MKTNVVNHQFDFGVYIKVDFYQVGRACFLPGLHAHSSNGTSRVAQRHVHAF